jgi:hypothetical protein
VNVFISYARRDQASATQLRTDIGQLGHPVWFDRDVTGGHQWWSTILRQIQECGVFVFVLSPDSVRSRACLAELQYALDLRRPILPIMVRPVNPSTAPPAIANTQIVDYTNRSTDTVFTLLKAFNAVPPAGSPPVPLPAPPEIPTSYLNHFLKSLESPELTFTDQANLLVQLRARLSEEEDQTTIWDMLVRLRGRADLAQSLVADLDEVLAPGWRPDPGFRFEGRYWDGHDWTSRVWQDGREFDERNPQPAAGPQAPQPIPVMMPRQPAVRPKRKAAPWIIVGSVAAVAIVVTLIIVLVSGGGAGRSPQSVAQAFVDAMTARDGDTLAGLACAKDSNEVRDVSGLAGVTNIRLESVNAGDSSGTMTISATFDGTNDRHNLALVKENGEWKVCSP